MEIEKRKLEREISELRIAIEVSYFTPFSNFSNLFMSHNELKVVSETKPYRPIVIFLIKHVIMRFIIIPVHGTVFPVFFIKTPHYFLHLKLLNVW